ncbi:MAG: tyrosine-type recombinase/integrase [Verrucomicrobiae bacterium]|nr:tyrosine-type recombinase/integrase [Verrucomicrobiae bacterium]
MKLERITPERVNAWKNIRLREFRDDPEKRNQTIVTINSLIRNAKALFARKNLAFLRAKLDLPEVLPFDGVSMEKSPSLRYHSKIDAKKIMENAHKELAGNDDEVFKALLLALVCGLRRSEIDNLLWEKFDFANRTLSIESTKYRQLKSSDSAGEIDLNQTTAEIFQSFRQASPEDQFVIKGNPPRQINCSRDYRCNQIFDRLNNWLRSQGVDSMKPTHTLRKEVGSIIAAQHGIFAASRYLRHANLTITAQLYADKKHTVVPDFG